MHTSVCISFLFFLSLNDLLFFVTQSLSLYSYLYISLFYSFLFTLHSELRRMSNSNNVISATVRQLESLHRIATAFARMRLSPVVTLRDMKESMSLIQDAMKQAATDPTTGVVDVNKLLTGSSAGDALRLSQLEQQVRNVLSENVRQHIPLTSIEAKLRSGVNALVFTRDELETLLRSLASREEVVLTEDPQGMDMLVQPRKGIESVE